MVTCIYFAMVWTTKSLANKLAKNVTLHFKFLYFDVICPYKLAVILSVINLCPNKNATGDLFTLKFYLPFDAIALGNLENKLKWLLFFVVLLQHRTVYKEEWLRYVLNNRYLFVIKVKFFSNTILLCFLFTLKDKPISGQCFHFTVYPLKKLGDQMFSGVFRRCKMGTYWPEIG